MTEEQAEEPVTERYLRFTGFPERVTWKPKDEAEVFEGYTVRVGDLIKVTPDQAEWFLSSGAFAAISVDDWTAYHAAALAAATAEDGTVIRPPAAPGVQPRYLVSEGAAASSKEAS